jgi:DNA-binding NarL/FixJ family response regulator
MRIVVADDEHLFRGLLVRDLITHQIDVVGQAASVPELIITVRATVPDLVLTDQRMPNHDRDAGLRAALQIRQEHPQIGVILLSAYGEAEYASELLYKLDDRAVGYILKQQVHEVAQLIPQMQRVAAGGVALDPCFLNRVFARRHVNNPLDRLAPHELRILKLMAEGRSNAAIALETGTSEGAVEKAITGLHRKLDIDKPKNTNKRVSAVLAFLRHTGRLVRPDTAYHSPQDPSNTE